MSVVGVVVAVAALSAPLLFAAGARAGRDIERGVRRATRTVQVVVLSLVFGAALAPTQWAVLTHLPSPSVATLVLVLGVPGVLAGATIARLFGLDTTVRARRRRVRR